MLFFLTCFLSFADVLVVSDLDDTLRQINVGRPGQSAWRLAKRDVKPFIAMRAIFQDLAKIKGVRFVYLSASYRFLYDAKKWLKDWDFPLDPKRDRVFQRNYQDPIDSRIFKENKLKEILNENSYGKYFFFGDDGEQDLNIYHEVVNGFQIARDSIISIRDVTTEYTFRTDRILEPPPEIFFIEKQLINSPLGPYLSTETRYALRRQSYSSVPNFLIGNLARRIQQQDCQNVSFMTGWLCRFQSNRKARTVIREFVDELKEKDYALDNPTSF